MSMITAEMLWERFLDRDDYDALIGADSEIQKTDAITIDATQRAVRDHKECNRIIELTPNGAIDKLMEYDDYITDENIKTLRGKMYR